MYTLQLSNVSEIDVFGDRVTNNDDASVSSRLHTLSMLVSCQAFALSDKLPTMGRFATVADAHAAAVRAFPDSGIAPIEGTFQFVQHEATSYAGHSGVYVRIVREGQERYA